jgi:hypothetical protein
MENKKLNVFPRLSLKKAIQVMRDAMDSGQNWSKEEFTTFGTRNNTKGSANSGAFLTRIIALRNYGLITVGKDTISATDLANRIINPIDDNEHEEAIREAFLSPASFNEIVETVGRESDFLKTAITKIAVNKLGIPRKHMEKFARNFLESGKHAGVIVEPEVDHFQIQPIASQSYTEQADSVTLEQDNDSSTVQEITVETDIQEEFKEQLTLHATDASVYGAQHKGQNWQLNLQVLINLRVPADLRKNIRDLVANAYEIADMLYVFEEKGGYNVV